MAVIIVLGLPIGAMAQQETAQGQPVEADHPAKEVVLRLTRAIDYFDLAVFVGSFSDDVSMFYPIPGMAERVDGLEALTQRQKTVFDSLRKQFEAAGQTEPPFFKLKAEDMRLQPLAEGVVVLTWHVDRGANQGRRTAVVQEQPDGAWKIVSFHSSNLPKSTR